MSRKSILKRQVTRYENEIQGAVVPLPLHKWLLIVGSVFIFLVLPFLFIWSSLDLIHPRVGGQEELISDAGLHAQQPLEGSHHERN